MKRIISILTVLVLLLSCPVAMADYIVPGDTMVDTILPGMYWGTEGIYSYRQYDEKITITECSDKTLESVVIPQTIKGLPVVGVDYEAFKEFANLESVTFPDTVTLIGNSAFYNCRKLETVNFPASLKRIAPSAFANCVSLKEINLPEGVETIMNSAFSNCSSLQQLVIPSTVKEIGACVFNDCRSLKSAVLPDGITKMDSDVFVGCEALESVNIPANLERLEDYMFCGCISLKSIKLPDTLTYIGDYALKGCPITEINIPDGVSEIGDAAFCSTKLKSITLPSGITSIGSWAFNGTDITSIDIPKSMTVISDEMVSGCHSLKTINLPDTITEIGVSAFGSTAIEQIEIPASVKKIGAYAFNDCDMLKEVVIPDGVELIDVRTFSRCDNLERVYIPTSVTGICVGTFEYCPKPPVIYYGGSREQFNKIYLRDVTSKELNGMKIVYYNEPFEKENVDTSKKFTDVKAGKWYKQYIDYAYTNGIFDGMSKTTFAPESNITRAQFVMVLANLSGIFVKGKYVAPQKKDEIGFAFDDVGYNKWYSGAIAWAYDNDIVAGVSENSFGPNMPITREQMCTMLVRYANYCGITLGSVEKKTTFADDKSISKWAKSAVYACQMADIVNGKGANEFDPKNTGTRAEAAVIFTKFRKSYLKGE